MLSGSQGPFVCLSSLERDHDDSMADQIFSSSNGRLAVHFLVLFLDSFTVFINGFISSCKLNAATMAASKYEGRSAVFSRCSELPAAGFKNVLMNTG